MKHATFYIATLLVVLWLQLASQYFFGASGFSADFILCVVLYFGMARGALLGVLFGFFWGLLIDASALGLLGVHALLYAAAGYTAGVLRRQLDENKIWTQTIFTFGVSILFLLCYFLLDRLFAENPRPLLWSLGIQPFINGLVAPVIFWFIRKWSQAWDMTVREE